MNQVIIDNALLVIACITALLVTRSTKERKIPVVASFFLLFSHLIIFLNMWAHTIAVLFVNYERYQAGNFQFSFHFYSLLFLGIVFIIVSGINISCARKRIKGDGTQKPLMLCLNAGTALLFLPLILLNPISLLPVLASITSSITLLFIKSAAPTLVYNSNNRSPWARQNIEVNP